MYKTEHSNGPYNFINISNVTTDSNQIKLYSVVSSKPNYIKTYQINWMTAS